MKVIAAILVIALVLIVAAVWWGLRRTYRVEHSQNQVVFRRGTADTTSLDGEYGGLVTGYSGSWQGKTFDHSTNSGINRFRENGTVVQKYPFKTSLAKGLRDPAMDVVTLDYNQPGNPWWLKFVVDEIVSVAPNTYLGKVHLRLAPRLVFSVGYFTLRKFD